MAVVELKRRSGDHVGSDDRSRSFRGWGKRAMYGYQLANGHVCKYISCYERGDIHSVVSSVSQGLLTQRTRPPPTHCRGGFKDHWRYQLANGHDTAPPEAWMPLVSRSGFMPDGVAQQCPAASMPVTAWSRRPQSPITVKMQDTTATCLADRRSYINTRLPDLRNRSLSRTSPPHDETSISGCSSRLDKYNR